MSRFVVAHRLEHRNIGPFAGRRGPVFFKHFANCFTQLAQFGRFCPDHMPRHDRRGSLPECAGLHVVGKVSDLVTIGLEVNGDRGATQLRMGGGRRVRRRQPAEAGDISRQFENSRVVNLVEHCCFFNVPVWRFASAAQMNI